ncbi:HlyD family secretion protein [Thiothrix eikelboomii]|uniref:HlyD family secretion protein n=1 Tax=Thiothrix eikelboomii TaxID=92487 RepID=UPI003BB1E6EB
MTNIQSSHDSVKAVLGQPAAKKSGFGKRLVTLVILAALGGGGYWYYQQYQANGGVKTEVPAYQTEVLKRGDLNLTVIATGNLQPMNQVDIGTEQSGTVAEVLVDANATVTKGQILAKLNTNQLEDNLTKAEAALITAEAKVAQAKAQLTQADANILKAEASIQQALAGERQSSAQIQQVGAQVQQNQAQLQQANAQIQSAEAQLAQAKASTAEARAQLGRLQTLYKTSGGKLPSKAELTTAQAALQRAQAAEQAAKSSADSSRANATAARASISASQANVESAKAGSGASSANVSGLKASAAATKAEKLSAQAALEAAQAGVKEAQANVRSAQANLAKATITSPIDGVVLTRSVEPGQTVAASLSAPTLFTLAEDLKQMELQVSVDEANVGQVKEGQAAEFTVDAWPGRKYQGKITLVSLGSTLTDNVVSYLTKLNVENTDLTLRPGMTANATISTQSRKAVLLVPNAALRFKPASPEEAKTTAPAQQTGGGLVSQLMPRPPMQRQRGQGQGQGGAGRGQGQGRRSGRGEIWILKDGIPSAVKVKIGLSDSKFTEVSADELTEGDLVITGAAIGAKP